MGVKLKGLSLNIKKEDIDVELEIDEVTLDLGDLFSLISEDEIMSLLGDIDITEEGFGESLSYDNEKENNKEISLNKKNVMYDLNNMMSETSKSKNPKGLLPIDQYFESSFDYCVWFVDDESFLSNSFINADSNTPVDFFVGVHFKDYNGKTAMGFETQFAFENFMGDVQRKFEKHLPSNNVQIGVMMEPLTQIRKKAGDNVFGELKYTNTQI